MSEIISILVNASSQEIAKDKAYNCMKEMDCVLYDYFNEEPEEIINGTSKEFRFKMQELCINRRNLYESYRKRKIDNTHAWNLYNKCRALKCLTGEIKAGIPYYDAYRHSTAFLQETLIAIKKEPDKFWLVDFYYHS